MINIFRKNKKSRHFQKLLKPNPDFVRRTGFLFLSAFSQKFGRDLGPATPRAFRYFLRGLISGIASMIIISSGATYADQKNVGPDNLLYPLKRAQEAVSLTLSNSEEKPVLHLKLAERRLEEIEEVKQKDPSSEKILGLSDDLREQLRSSVGALNGDEIVDIEDEKLESASAEKPLIPHLTTTTSVQPIKREEKPFSKKQIFTEKSGPSICASFRALITSQGSEVRQVVGENPKLIEKFEKKCLPIILRQTEKTLQKIEESSMDESKFEMDNKDNQEKKVEKNNNLKND